MKMKAKQKRTITVQRSTWPTVPRRHFAICTLDCNASVKASTSIVKRRERNVGGVLALLLGDERLGGLLNI